MVTPTGPAGAGHRPRRAIQAVRRGVQPVRPVGGGLGQQTVGQGADVGVEMSAEHVAQDRPQVLGDLLDEPSASAGIDCRRDSGDHRALQRDRVSDALAPAAARSSGGAQMTARRLASRPLEGPSGSSSARSASR